MLHFYIDQTAQSNRDNGDISGEGLHLVEALGVTRILIEFFFVNDRLQKRTAHQVLVLGLEVILFSGFQIQGISEIQWIIVLAINLNAHGGLVDWNSAEQVNRRQNQNREKRCDYQPAPFQDHMPVMPQIGGLSESALLLLLVLN